MNVAQSGALSSFQDYVQPHPFPIHFDYYYLICLSSLSSPLASPCFPARHASHVCCQPCEVNLLPPSDLPSVAV